MTDRKALPDPNDTPEDVATLYTWANLHGVKYRDFSASKAQEKSRQRVQEAFEAERRRIRGEAKAQEWSEADAAAEAAIMAEARRNQEEAAREQALKAEQQAAQRAADALRPASIDSNAANQQAPGGFSQWQPNGAPSQPAYSLPVSQPLYEAPANPAQYVPAPQPPALLAREESLRERGDLLHVRNPWAPVETTEAAAAPGCPRPRMLKCRSSEFCHPFRKTLCRLRVTG